MADIRINALPTTATDFASDDYIAIDGTTNGTRKLNAKTANLTFSDVTLGTSGPSVKSTLSARAPRQGLVFDGTAGSSGTLGSIPSGTWTVSAVIDVPTSNPAANLMALTMGIGYGVAGGGSFVLGDINPSGNLTISQWAGTFPAYREATISGFRAAYSGKRVHIAAVVTGAALTVYINGVATSYTEASGAGAPAWGATLGSANVFVGKGQSALYYFSGGIYAPYIYNRALSASEVVSLYEAGAPAGADYATPAATNTSLSVNAWTNAASPYSTFTGATATGFTAAQSAATVSYCYSDPAFTVKTGTVIRCKFNATLTSGAVPLIRIDEIGVAARSANVAVTAGSNTVDLVATGSGSVRVIFVTTAATSFAISSFTATPLGLLLAPDAAQAGGGLVWYDTSGNAANITLPASGVSWNVPSSRVLGGNWTTSGNHVVSGGSIGVGGAVGSYFDILQGGNDAYAYNRRAGQLIFGTNNTTVMQFASNGNCLLKSDGIDGGQKLQVGGNALISGGSLAIGAFASLTAATATFYSQNSGGGNRSWSIGTSALAGADNQYGLVIRDVTGGVNALQLAYDTGNATFAGTGRFNGAAAGAVLNLKETAGVPTALNFTNRNSTQTWSVAVDGASVDDKLLAFIESGSVRWSLAATTGDATFAGKLYSVSGTATTPAFSFTGDTGTGMYRSSAGIGALAASGSTAAFWANNVFAIYSGVPLRLGNAYTAGAPTATGYVTIQDSAGNTYKVLVGT